MRIVLATHNPGKVAELRQLLPDTVEVLSVAEFDARPPAETGDTFEENAIVKALAASRFGDAAIADDSGLEVYALGGAPGVRSARYAGDDASDDDNNTKLLAAMEPLTQERRGARFVSVVALARQQDVVAVASGAVEGWITRSPRGANGFGYDPLFEITDPAAPWAEGRTMAELTLSEKNRISHRSRAYRALLDKLTQIGWDIS